jgi:hypothetical protein
MVTIAIVFVILVLETVQRTVHGGYIWRRFAQASVADQDCCKSSGVAAAV